MKLVTWPMCHYSSLSMGWLFIVSALIILYFNNKIIDFDHEFLLLFYQFRIEISNDKNMKCNAYMKIKRLHARQFISWHFFINYYYNLCSVPFRNRQSCVCVCVCYFSTIREFVIIEYYYHGEWWSVPCALCRHQSA